MLLAGLITCGCVVGLATVRASAINAVLSGIVGDRGYPSGYVMQAVTPSAAKSLARLDEVTPVATTSTDVSTPTSVAKAVILVQGNNKVWLQHLVKGLRPASGHDVTLSRHLAQTLGVRVGGTVTISLPAGKRTLRVSGLTADPAHRSDVTAVLLLPGLGGLHVNQWLMPGLPDQESHPQIFSLLQSQALQVSSTKGAVQEARYNPPSVVSAMRFLPTGVGILLTLLALTLVAALRPAGIRDATALIGSGFSSRQAWRVVATAAALAGTGGAIVGVGLCIAVTHVFSQELSAPLGQAWLRVTVPVLPVVAMIVVPSVLALVARPALSAASRARAWLVRPRLQGRVGLLLALVSVLVGVGLMTYASWRQHQAKPTRDGLVALWGLLLLSGGLLAPFAVTFRMNARAAVGHAVEYLGKQFVLASVVGLLIATATAGYAALTMHDANAIDRITVGPQPPGSLLINGVSNQAAKQLTDDYRRLGGTRANSYQIAASAAGVARVTTPEVARCLQGGDQLTACIARHSGAAVNVIGLSSSVPKNVAIADESVTAHGQVGLVILGRSQPIATGVDVVPAISRPGLGGNLPSVILNPNGPVAKKAGLTPSGNVLLALLDFSHLTDTHAATFKSDVARLAPAGQVSEFGNEGSQQDRSLAHAVALAGAGLAATIILLGGGAVVAGSRRFRMVLPALGASTPVRLAMAARVFLSAALPAALVAVLLPWTVRTASSVRAEGSIGWMWSIPLAATVISLLVPVIAFASVPTRNQD